MREDNVKITFDKALEVLKVNQQPVSGSNLLLNILGLSSGENSEDILRAANVVRSKANDVNLQIHRNPWKYIPISLGLGLMAGLSVSHYLRRRQEVQVD